MGVFTELLLFPVLFLCLAIAFLVFEIPLKQAHKQPWFNRESAIDFGYGWLNHLINLTIITWLGFLLQEYVVNPYLPNHPFGITIANWPFAGQLLLAIFLIDFYQYWRHRFSHKFFWKLHAAHHSAPEMRWSVHYRFHPLEMVYNNLGMIIFLNLFGFPLMYVGWVSFIGLVNNMYQHCNIDLRMPSFLRYVITSPNYHKWHHATELEAQDKNFADFFPLLDVIFGTYYYPENGKVFPKRYGVAEQPEGSSFYRNWWQQLIYPLKT